MHTDVGGEDLADGCSIGWGVSCDPFQCVDATQAHVDLVAAQLIDRLHETLGDLTLPLDFLLLPVKAVLLLAGFDVVL